jgi:hypothetical protein
MTSVSNEELFNLIQDLTQKYNQLKKDFDNLASLGGLGGLGKVKGVSRVGGCPSITFTEWYKSKILVLDTHFESLIHHSNNTFLDAIILVLKDGFDCANDCDVWPIVKTNHLFIYDVDVDVDVGENKRSWKKLEKKELTKLMKYLHKQFVTHLSEWQQKNKDEIKQKGNFDDLYNKVAMKILKVSFETDSQISNKVFQFIKTYFDFDT